MNEQPRRVVALWFVAGAWLASYLLLAYHGARLLPLWAARELTQQSFLLLVQIVTLGFGLVLTLLLVREPRRELGLLRPSPAGIGLGLLLAPVAYVASSYLAIWVALPTLLEELARGGRQLAQQSTGEFGRSITQAPLASTLLWAVVLAPIAEEFLFRGAIWSALQRTVELVKPAPEAQAPTSLELGLPIEEGPLARAVRGAGRWFSSGGIATLTSTAIFTAMHADMEGGLGIVRVVSAGGLGLCCALARQHSGGLFVPIALHVAYNALSLATTRRWVVSESFPMFRGVPTLLSLIAGVCLLLVVIGLVVRAITRLRRASDPPPTR